ncbi:50S ribosomal protein L15 [Candidatus Daviesbacteria bacterium RIFCSPLOWO2_02_FULL_36_8]|uniref:Large ribosomal subunit protein uL15 n=1 Tax=Candidatus Daviesbacteria bacterium RIFCSPLOWO2_02_FULL_36_8 TaxID=1797793 RepID=A0A1F5MFN3_9BACT|nr:MAG: 50S ribosomal protein L15 [Candidatus Daviesbacteria bacterium RIFCSPLOWO2_02_FULL_36_8]HLC37723.1 50S ribosomal protein L15 [Candidatus Nanoarchaeia archaeon]
MQLNELVKIKKRDKKRLGRGLGSGLGKTSGRGTKGQKARGKMPVAFTGAGLPTYKKLPLKRGLGNFSGRDKLKVINLSKLNVFKEKSVVDLEALIKMKIITSKEAKKGVKILADKGLTTSLIIKLPVSAEAKIQIEKKGGKVENV